MANAERVSITMRKETLLVIFEFLAKSYDEWTKSEEVRVRAVGDDSFVLKKPDSGERVALWRLEGEIERTLPEIFAPDYAELIRVEKARLTTELYGTGQAG